MVSPKNLVQLVNCLLLERKVILISKQIGINAILIESLLELLLPLDKTIFLNISYLKSEMIDYIDSPVPYLIGLSESIWNKIAMTKWNEVADDTVAFHIDTALLMSKLDLPLNPEPMTSALITTLEDL
jgi:hypothetical protein